MFTFFYYATQEVSTVPDQLQFGSGNHGVAYRGVADAFPYATIPSLESGGKGIYQIYTKPDPSCALISIQFAIAVDGRIFVMTRSGEELNLSNRSRAYNPSGIGKVRLPVQEPTSEDDVCGVILVSFGSERLSGNYQGVCEGILLRSGAEDSNQGTVYSDRNGCLHN